MINTLYHGQVISELPPGYTQTSLIRDSDKLKIWYSTFIYFTYQKANNKDTHQSVPMCCIESNSKVIDSNFKFSSYPHTHYCTLFGLEVER